MKRCSFLILFVSVLLCSLFAESTIYRVAPYKNSSSCYDDLKCIDFLSFLLQNTSSKIDSHSILEFYPGKYSIDTIDLEHGVYELELTSLDNVTITSTEIGQKATINCSKGLKVIWIVKYSRNIHIQDIEMIECSGHFTALDNSNLLLESQFRNTPTAILLVQNINVFLKNVRANSLNGSVFRSIDTRGNLNILSSSLQGSTEIVYSDGFSSRGVTHITINSSIVYPGIYYKNNNKRLQQGVILQLRNHITADIIIFNTSFLGREKILGFLLDVTSYAYYLETCSLFSIYISHSRFFYGGMAIGGENYCNELSSAYLEQCIMSKMPTRSGVVLGKIMFQMSNCAVENSDVGLRIWTGSKGRITNCSIINSKNAMDITDYSSVTLEGDVYLSNNEGSEGFGAISIENSVLNFTGKTVIENTLGGKKAALTSTNTTLYFHGETRFVGNQGFYGGALSLYKYSIMHFYENANVVFTNNHAWRSGGAIYVDTMSYAQPGSDLRKQYSIGYQCFFYRKCRPNKCDRKNLHFCNNTSVEGGDAIYGGSISRCYFRKSTAESESHWKNINKRALQKFQQATTFCSSYNTSFQTSVTSSPYYLCFCQSSGIFCNTVEKKTTIVPGQTIQLSVVAVGQLQGATLATAQARLMLPYTEQLNSNRPYIPRSQARQLLGLTCTKVHYTVHAPIGNQTLVLGISELANEDVRMRLAEFTDNKFLRKEIHFTDEVPLLLHIIIQPCLPGYIYNTDNLACECLQPITAAGIQCNIDNQTVIRSGTVWVNATNDTVIIHSHCPLGYCNQKQTELSLTNPSVQCSFKRSGTLCGQCGGNLSQMLGSSECQECSNLWLLLIIPLTLVSGMLLVVLLMSMNLTVATGTINGLVLYANILRANNDIYFSVKTSKITEICNVFIAWINLDVGIEVCFYNGLDAFYKTLFQLAFPIYICTIAVTIIVSSHYSTRAARLSGNNAVQVLATLFLLSYSKSIRLVITIFSFTTLNLEHYNNGTSVPKLVWLYDGNIDYLQGKHIGLFLIGILILVMVSFPYTAVFIFIPCLQKVSHYRWLTWVWKMKPLFDAYTGPYKSKHRYWTGLLLLLRVLLYATFSLNIAGDPSINLLATSLLMMITLAYLLLIGNVYKSRALSILENAFLLNLTMLSVCSLFALLTGRDQELITDISIVITMTLFCGILIYQAYMRLMSLKIMKRFVKKQEAREEENHEEGYKERENNVVTMQIVSISDLEKPLLEMEHVTS